MNEYTESHGARLGGRTRLALWGGAACLLLLPLVAMQFTREVAWTPLDFVAFGAMLAGACGAFELAARVTMNRTYRAAAALALVTAFLLTWVNVAVGVIGSEQDPANLAFGGVLAVGLVGALLARLEARGMALALLAVAVAQALVAGAALVLRLDTPLALHGVFVALWLAAAVLFGRAARG